MLQPFQTDALGKKQVVQFFWGSTVLTADDARSANHDDNGHASGDGTPCPAAEAAATPARQASFLSFLEGGLQKALSAFSAVVSGSPGKKGGSAPDATEPLVHPSPSPAATQFFLPPSSPLRDSLPAKRLSSFATLSRYAVTARTHATNVSHWHVRSSPKKQPQGNEGENRSASQPAVVAAGHSHSPR